jgi:hypothetical protein
MEGCVLSFPKQFQRRRFFLIGQSETKYALFREDLSLMLPPKLEFIWLMGFRGEDKNVKS